MVERTALQLVIRTPHEVTLKTSVWSARVLTESGHVGLRPRTEPMVIAVEPGLMNIHRINDETSAEMFVGTAGGLMLCEHNTATLLTPLAVFGDNETSIVEQLDNLMQRPDSEMEARATLSKLEGHILTELRREQIQGITPRLD